MRRTIVTALALSLLASAALPAGGAPKYKRLGEDPALDAPAALDLTYLDVARTGKAIDIRFGIEGMLPQAGGYPELPGIEWVFTTGTRTFIAEVVAGTSPETARFFLFEIKDGGSFAQLENPTGTYDHADGFASVRVALKSIGAKKGTRLTGVDLGETEGDVDAHVHLGPMTHYADSFATTKPFRVP